MSYRWNDRTNRVIAATTNFLAFALDPAYLARGEDPEHCDFALGNPHEMPLPGVVDALQQAVPPQNKDWYAYKFNEPEATVPVAEGLRRRYGLNYQPEDIQVTTGAFGALAVALNAVINPGDEVIFISPPWFFYEAMILQAGGVPVRVKINPQTFDLDLEAIAAAVTPKTCAIIVNSPNNPTGKIYPPETLRGLAEILSAAGQRSGRPIFLISDESYSRIVYDGREFHTPAEFYPHTLLVYTYGKTLLTPGQRLGYLALHPDMPGKALVDQALMMAHILTAYAFPNAVMQRAVAGLEKLSIDIRHLQEKRDWMVSALCGAGYELHSPEGTFYLLVRSPVPDDAAFTRALMQRKVYCLPGSVAEMPGYFRISLTANDDMIRRALPVFAEVRQQAVVA